MKVLTINTYAGSLLLAAMAAKLEVVASLEDTDFGVDIQRMNFPDLKIYSKVGSWPKLDLRDVVVIAHPPCSAFSNQNNSAAKKGVDSDAFACTKKVLDYSMGNRAPVIFIESVIPALEGAREIHDRYADQHGYDVYRFLVNSADFGVPQDRGRFWVAFVDRDRQLAGWPADFHSKRKTLREVFEKEPLFSRADDQVIKHWNKQKAKWIDVLSQEEFESAKSLHIGDPSAPGVPATTTGGVMIQDLIDDVWSGRRGFGQINGLVQTKKDYDKFSLGGFRSKDLRLLNPDGLATVLLSDSAWMAPGRLLWAEEYFEIMGFPRDYKMPQKYMSGKFKTYLSKGVCPPVAQWFLEEAMRVFGPKAWLQYTHVVKPGETLDLRPSKRSLKAGKEEE